MIKPYEFWHPRVFEIPYYVYLGFQCLLNGVGIKTLAKANYNLDHGEIGLGSKYKSQQAFNQEHFLPTILIEDALSIAEKKAIIIDFVEQNNYPIILKSDVGCVGKGIVKINAEEELDKRIPLLVGDYIVQQYTPFEFECGIFYVRHKGQAEITGINIKHFPAVIGNGQDSILHLATAHPRFNQHWQSFLQYLDTSQIPEKDEKITLSFIGSHTLGCKFTDDSDILTPELQQAIFNAFDDQQGFNFGRVDVKSIDQEALLRGEFVIIEVNGVASLPTHMYDPEYSVFQAYKIFFAHAKHLVKIAKEHKDKPMELLSLRQVIAKTKHNQSMLNEVHRKLKS